MKAAILLIDLLEEYFQKGRLKANRSTLVSHIKMPCRILCNGT